MIKSLSENSGLSDDTRDAMYEKYLKLTGRLD